MATIANLRSLAALIKGATEVGENSAARVGGAIEEAAELIATLITQMETVISKNGTQDTSISTLQGSVGDLQTAVGTLQNTLNTLLNGDVTSAIESFNEVIAFLEGVQDDESLAGKLSDMSDTIDTKADAVELSDYVSENAQLPKSGVYLWHGNPVDSRMFTKSEGDTLWLVFCLRKGDDGDDDFGLKVTDCLVYETDGDNDPFIFNGRYYGSSVPGYVQKAFGYVMANDEHDGLMSAEDKVILDELANNPSREVICIDWWFDPAPRRMYNPQRAGLYWYMPGEGTLSVSVPVEGGEGFTFESVELRGDLLYIDITDKIPYIWKDDEMQPIAPKNVPASIFNATIEVPISGYYSLCDTENEGMSAVHAAWEAGKAVGGLMLSFELSAGVWKTYQFVGRSVTEANWLNPDNWKDFGSLAAGSEPYIVINDLIGAPVAGEYYTLESAVARLVAYQQESGVIYAKKGLIISYQVATNKMETKQFQGEVTDFGEVGLWQDFGGGGSEVETADTPEKNGTDALSTGGAYNAIPTEIGVDTETEGTVKLVLKNADGDQIGDEVQFNVGTGSGGGSGTIIAIAFRNNPLYGRAGSEFKVKAAIMSVTKAGNQETSNSISDVVFVNRTTKRTVATFSPRKASSASMSDYSFEFDLSSLGAQAGEVALQAIVTDDGGNTATKNLSMVVVDVTCVSVQTLNYTRDTSLEVGGNAKNIPMYKFPNNASDRGIRVTVEMYYAGEWHQLSQQVIMDTYSHNVLINPSGLAHGAYPIRIQGEDVSSGVQGNILHTAVMVIQQDETIADYNTPIVVARWSDEGGGTKKVYETLEFDVACYRRNSALNTVEIAIENVTKGTEKVIAEQVMVRTTTYHITKRLVEYADGDELLIKASCGLVENPEDFEVTMDGSLLPISETEGVVFEIDFSGRSNSDTDKSIVAECNDGSEDVEIVVSGSNYSSNGFVKDSYGTQDYGTVNDPGRMSLRIAEDVTAQSNIKPYANRSIETNGSALTFTTMVKNVADRNAVLMQCCGDKMGFIMTGEKLVVFTNGDPDDAATSCTVPFALDMVHRFDIVVEPSAVAPYAGIGVVKVFKDGDEVGAVKYTAGEFPNTDATVEWDGTDADIYLYGMKFWNTYYNFMQAFNNYLIGLTDTEAMISEYEKNDVMVSQTAEGTTKDRPSMQKCLDAGLVVVVLTKNPNTEDVAKNYPDYLEGLDGDKKTTIPLDWYCYFPGREWQNCIITEDPTSNQGTTSSWRKIKNKKAKHKKSKGMRLMYTREEISQMYGGDEDVLAKYDLAARMAAKKKLQVVEGGQFTNITTIKVDYSDSCGAHNGAMMDLMNETQMALGNDYMTPAQVFNEGDFEIHTSIDSVPCALFRTDHLMTAQEATDPANAYFHAKANFNADKGDAAFYGFEGTQGYNAACLNYGDFIELVAAQNQSLSNFKAAVLADTSSLIAGNIYVLSEYCGPGHVVLENDGTGSMTEVGAVDNPTEIEKTKAEIQAMDVDEFEWNVVYLSSDGHYMQYQGGSWEETTGTMTYNSGTKKWSVSGRVVNPVECYELLKYDSLCWMQGVNSVADLMAIDNTTGNPIWMSYYESRYPDDDDLNDKYERGLKAPYQLYRWLLFCQQCNQNLTAADGNITLDGASAVGNPTNRLRKWEHELHKYANVKSILCYTVASDYKACVDQRSKNMMIAFYLETDGLMKAYLNHWYDGDCVDGSDNDCGLTIPWDMDARTSHLYQGWDSVIFKQTYAAGSFWLNDGGSETITLNGVADAMRKAERNHIRVFSADGCYHFWVTKRLAKFAKVISAFDGERKYIENSTSADNYFFALHGLRLDDLPDYQRKRFKYCDGQYQVGDLYTNPFKARMMGTISITIKAAQDGFFGLGEDRADACADSCHLLAGESYTMMANTAQESGKMIYIFGADKLEKLDISACTPKLEAFSLEYCTLLEELIIGGATYTPDYTTGILSALELPAMPFLKKIDIRRTKIQTLTARNCPRLTQVYAENSSLKTFAPSESAPLTLLHLPASMTSLSLVNLPLLTYPNGGLTMAGVTNIASLRLSGCPNIDAYELLKDIVTGGATLAEVSMSVGNITKDESVLVSLMQMGTKGIGSELANGCDGLTGRWVLPTLLDDTTFNALKAYFTELDLVNSLYSDYVVSDNETDSESVTNMDNHTGYEYSNAYVPSGHILKIREKSVPVSGQFNASTQKMHLTKISKEHYKKYPDGTAYDNTDSIGEGKDNFIYVPKFWYKGINDFINQKKHYLLSSHRVMPSATYQNIRQNVLSEILYQDTVGIVMNSVTVGQEFTDACLDQLSSCAVYRMDVSGMKQVRYIGLNNAQYGAVFVDEDGVVLQKNALSITGVSGSPLDFQNANGDYIFRNVPSGAKYLYFTCIRGLSDVGHEVHSVDSEDIEAIEPGWVEHKAELIGIYGASVDDLGLIRSISGKVTKRGTGTSTTSSEWRYDENGEPTNMPVGSLNYTGQDFYNLCYRRGKGYHDVSYEQNKIIAILSLCWCGDRDDQAVYGSGTSAGYTTGSLDSMGFADTASGFNKIWGLEGWVACNWEFMDYVGVNVSSFEAWKKNQRPQSGTVDAKWHIYDPHTGTERVVQGITDSGKDIARLKHGRYCDIIPSSLNSDSSNWSTCWAAGFYYTASGGRVVGRAYGNAYANGGCVFANASSASTYSSASYGARLAFSGEFENESDIDEDA